MKYKIVNPQSSLEKVIFGVESNLERRNYDLNIEKLNNKSEVIIEVSKSLVYPKIYMDDTLVHEGSFPNVSELKSIFGSIINEEDLEQSSGLLEASNDKRVGICCGVGGDVYLDPYENN